MTAADEPRRVSAADEPRAPAGAEPSGGDQAPGGRPAPRWADDRALAAGTAPSGGPAGSAPGPAPLGEDVAVMTGGGSVWESVGALLVSATVLRIGIVGAGLAVLNDLTELNGFRPNQLVLGVIAGGQALSEMVCAPFLARYADRFGRRRFLVGGPVVGIVCALLVAVATSTLQIGIFRVLEGVAAAAFVPTALGLLAAATSHNHALRAQASGAFEATTLLGYAGGVVLGSFAWHYLHRATFLIVAALYLTASLVCHRFVPAVPRMHVSPMRVILRAVGGRGPVRAFLPAWVSVNALVAAFYLNISPLLRRFPGPHEHQILIRHLDDRVVGVVLLLWIVLIVLGIAIWTPWLTRLGPVRMMRSAVPGAGLLVITLYVMNHTTLTAVAFLLPVAAIATVWMAGFGPAAVAYLSDTSERLASDRSALMAFYTLSLAGGGVLGDLLGGVFTRWQLLDGLLLLGMTLVAIAMAALSFVAGYEQTLAAAN